jgi:hypothetical protein
MSIEGTVVGSVPGPPDDPQGLQQEIERTREHLGETVEALMAKVDVKARAQDEASRLIGRLKLRVVQARQQAAARAGQARRQAADKAAEAREQAAARAGQVQGQAVDKAAGAREQAAARGRHVRRRMAGRTDGPRQPVASWGGPAEGQVRRQAAAVAAGISNVTPEPVKQAAGNAAATARRRRTPLLAAVGAIGAGLVGWLLFQRWRRRG